MTRTKVLIVDDDPDVVFVTRTLLAKEGFQVEEADDGVSGLKKILEDTPDIVVLDVMMPGMDGYEVCERIKQGEQGASLPIVMLSAKAGENDIERGFASGADEYITKPFEAEDLLAAIQRLTQRSIGVEKPWVTTDPLAVRDQDVRSFVKTHLHSLSQWTILDFFIKRPDQAIPVAEVASWYSNGSETQVEADLEALASSGALLYEDEAGLYRITNDPDTQQAMQKFFDYCGQLDARLRVICMILEEGS